MEYMESVKELEEKMVANQQKHDSDGFINGKCNREVILPSHMLLFENGVVLMIGRMLIYMSDIEIY